MSESDKTLSDISRIDFVVPASTLAWRKLEREGR